MMGVLTYGGPAIVLLLYPGMETIAFNMNLCRLTTTLLLRCETV